MYKCPKCGFTVSDDDYEFFEENKQRYCPGRVPLEGTLRKTRQCAYSLSMFKKDQTTEVVSRYRTKIK